jgi:mRNA interferase RelE/StbE
MFKIVFHKSASKKFARLTPGDRERIARVIDSLTVNPYFGKKLHGELEGSCRLRVGDFRIIYNILENEKIILVHTLGSRGDVYK